MKYTGLVRRKVKNGRVKIYGKIFEPQNIYLEYDGRLDGLWYWFGVYPKGVEMGDMVSLWGNDELYHNRTTEYGPELVDGSFPWAWWEAV